MRNPTSATRWAAPLLLAVGAVGLTAFGSPALTPTELVERSIAHHDPDGRWWSERHEIEMVQTRPDAADRRVEVSLHPSPDRFGVRIARGADRIEGRKDGDECSWARPDGGEVPASTRELVGELTCERLEFWQRYQTFLLSLPMNLRDEGAELAPVVTSATFDGRPVDGLGVRYGEGEPEYELYFDPESHALVGLRFTRDGTDGEYIVFDGEIEGGGVRLPRDRSWYMNADDALLGVDRIVSLSRQEDRSP